jgi:hypothetical protein
MKRLAAGSGTSAFFSISHVEFLEHSYTLDNSKYPTFTVIRNQQITLTQVRRHRGPQRATREGQKDHSVLGLSEQRNMGKRMDSCSA